MKQIKNLLLAGAILLFTGCGTVDDLVDKYSDDSEDPNALIYLQISPDYINGTIGSTEQLTVTAPFADQDTEYIANDLTWSVEDNTIATIDSNGLLELLSAGSTTVSVQNADGAQAGIYITVLPGNFISIEFDLPETTLPNNSMVDYKIYGIGEDNSKVDLSTYEYSNNLEVLVEDDTILEFSGGQLFTKNVGTSKVTIKYGNLESSYTFTVINGTEISGLYSTDLTLTKDNSPYILTDNIQIGYDAVLAIEPGVQLYNNNYAVTVFGQLNAQGADDDKIALNNIFFSPGMNPQNDRSIINIDNAIVRGGEVYGWMGTGAGSGSLNLTNSIVTMSNNFTGSGSIYLSYPNADCYIERNIFVNSGFIDVSVSYVYDVGHDVTVYIKNNIFDQPQAVVSSGMYDSSAIIVQYNTFLDTNGTAITLSGEDGAITTASNNYWSTTDITVIESMIYDENDDFTVKNSLEFEPFLSEPDSGTPVYDTTDM